MTAMESLFRQPFTMALGWALVHFLWQGALIALLFAFVNLLLRRSSAGLRYGNACGAMLLMPVVSAATFLWLIVNGTTGAPAPSVVFASVLRPAQVLGGAAVRMAASGSATVQIEEWLNSHLAWLIALWSLGVVILSVRTAGGWIFAQSLKRQSTNPAEAAWQEALARLARRLNVRRPVMLCESAIAKVPTVIGWLRPAILLPVSALAGLTPELMEALVAHELAHIRRHDYLLNMVQTAVETLLFYHPAVWWVGKRIRRERENCCDDMAVAACGDALIYARALTEMAELRSGQPQLAMAANGGSLIARIRRLIGVRDATSRTPATWMAGVIALLGIGAVWATGSLSISYVHDNPPMAEAQLATAAGESATPEPRDPAPDPPDPQAPSTAPAQSSGGEAKDFIGGLAAAGYQNLSVDQLITFKIHDVTPEFVKQMEAMGFHHPTPDELVSMKIHDVTPAFVNEMKSAGFAGLSIDQLVSFKIHDVDPARLKDMQKVWGKLTPDEVLTAQIHDVTPEYAGRMKSLGLGEPSFDQLVAMKIHGVTPEFAKDILATGLKGVSIDQLVAFRIHEVDPARVAEIQKLGFGQLDAEEIVALQIHDVTPEFLRGFKDLGFTKLTLEEALEASIHGVTPEFVKAARKHGFNNLSMEQIIKLKQFDILSDKSN